MQDRPENPEAAFNAAHPLKHLTPAQFMALGGNAVVYVRPIKGAALAAMMAEDGYAAAVDPLAPKKPHVPPRAKNVIWCFMVDAARQRIASTLPLDESLMEGVPERAAQPRVAFGLLVESGMVAPGTILTDARRRWQAEVRADGSLACGADAGSIHKLGATLQSAPSCNGWTFWHIEEAGALVAIDALRQRHLADAG